MPVIFAVIAAVVFLVFESSLGPLGPVLKATPVALLALSVWRSGRSWVTLLATAGLVASALADVAIEFSFLGGLLVFLVAHLFYIAAFTWVAPRLQLWRLGPVAIWAVLALPTFSSRAGPLGTPVLIYGVVIFAMIWRAAVAVSKIGWNPAVIGFAGAILFGISDTLLAFNRFVSPLPSSDLLILGTYWAGQALIATSFRRAD